FFAISTMYSVISRVAADSLQGQVSWIAPVARTLLKARVGDVLKLVTPVGVEEIEVLAVDYPAPAGQG
ncbi:MAG: GreA/GreB family elongation factor, partial [Curvibacter sp.]